MGGRWSRRLLPTLVAALAHAGSLAGAESPSEIARKALGEGQRLWQLRRTRSAIEALEGAAKDREASAEAQYRLGRIYFFKGWESEGAFPGWHEEPGYREQALAAFRAAIAARPAWPDPRVGLGEALLRAGRASDALASFDEALAREPSAEAARVGRWKALKALGRTEAIAPEVAASAKASDPRLLGAARQGYELLGQQAEADALTKQVLERLPNSPTAEAARADRIQAARGAKQYAAVIEEARAFAEPFPGSARLPAVLDALLEAYQATPSTTAEAIAAAIDARLKARPDPGAYLAWAGLLAGRGVMLDRVVKLAEDAVPAAETFIDENLGSYKLADKARGSLNRTRAAAADLIGWAHFLKGDAETAAARLAEADRLSRGQDLANQFHLGELARTQGALEDARERYLNALSLAAGPEPLRAAARKALAEVYARLGNDPAGFEAWAQAEFQRRREQRHADALRSLVDRPAPPLKLTDLSGRTLDLLALRGKALVLNFFASW